MHLYSWVGLIHPDGLRGHVPLARSNPFDPARILDLLLSHSLSLHPYKTTASGCCVFSALRHTSPLRSIAAMIRHRWCAVATSAIFLRSGSSFITCSKNALMVGLKRTHDHAASHS